MLTRLRWEMSKSGGLQHLNKNDSLAEKADRVIVTDFTVTTNANGVCYLNNFSANNATPIIAYNSDGYGFLIRRSSDNTTKYWIATVTNPSGALVKNASVDVTLRYIPYVWLG